MIRDSLGWLAKNLGTLLLAFVLAVVVWVSAVWSANPNEEGVLQRPVPIQIIGQDPGLQIMSAYETNVNLGLKAPRSVWEELNSNENTISAWVDLSGLGPGEHTIPVQVQIDPDLLVRQVSQTPMELTLTLEPIVTQSFSVSLKVSGEPPEGYVAGTPTLEPPEVSISGPQSTVLRVKEVRVTVDIDGANETITKSMAPVALDADGKTVTGLTISPDRIAISQPIELLGGFRYVIVKPVQTGQVANGYRPTNILVSPVGVVVFSPDQQLVDNLPGYVETKPIDLTGADDDFEILIELDLPEGVSVVGDPKVLVQVSIAAIESSLSMSLQVEIIGLAPVLEVAVAPTTVDVILSGPVPVLQELESTDIRVKIDLTGFDVGTFQISPVVEILPERVETVSVLPDTVEVIITLAPTPTPTPSPTPTLTPITTETPMVTGTPTPAPTP